MANQLNPIKIPAKVWVNLFAEAGITVGTAIRLQNLGPRILKTMEKSSVPIAGDGYNVVEGWKEKVLDVGNVGAWAWSHRSTFVQVEIQ